MINFPFIQLWLLNTRSQTVLLTSLIVLRVFIAVVHFTIETWNLFFLSISPFSYSTPLYYSPSFLSPKFLPVPKHSVAPFPKLPCFYAPAFLIFPPLPLFPFTLCGGACLITQKTELPEPSPGLQALGLWALHPRKLQGLCSPLLWDISPELYEINSQFISGQKLYIKL